MNSYGRRNEILLSIGFDSYAEYLKSDLWRVIRRLAFVTLGKQCFHCGNSAEMIHHGEYSHAVLLGRSLHGLIPVCEKCHHDAEFSKSGNKRSLEEANEWLGFKCHVHKGKNHHRKRQNQPQKNHKWNGRGIPPTVGPRTPMVKVGQPCRKCETPVIHKDSRKKELKDGQSYGYKWYLYCPKCRTMYFVEEARYSPAEYDDLDETEQGLDHLRSIQKETDG